MSVSIYKYPDIFRAVHMEAPAEIDGEVRFLEKVWRRHLGKLPERVLDLAAGNTPHGQLLARKGVEIVAVDRSPTMIARGRRESRGLPITFHRGSIEKFRIRAPLCGAAIFMSETFPVIIKDRDVESHLRSVAAVLRDGALYCIDIDKQDLYEAVQRRTLWRRRRVRLGRTIVDVTEFRRPVAWYSALHSIYELNCKIDFGNSVVKTRDLIPIRYWTPGLLDWAARATGLFELITCYADYSMTRSIEKCDRRWLAVLKWR